MSRLTINFVSSDQCDSVRVFRKEKGEDNFTQISTVAPGSRFYVDTEVEFGKQYVYKIGIVFNSENKIYYSNEMYYDLRENLLIGGKNSNISWFMYDNKRIRHYPTTRTDIIRAIDSDVEGNVYYLTNSCELFCLQPDGNIKWRIPNPGYSAHAEIDIQVTASGFVYHTMGNKLIKRNAKTGAFVWEYKSDLTGNIKGIAVTSIDHVFMLADDRLWFMNRDGVPYWMINTPVGIQYDIATTPNNFVYIVGDSGNLLRCFNSSGVQQWQLNTGSSPRYVRTHHALPDLVYVMDSSSNLQVINAQTQEIVERFTNLKVSSSTGLTMLHDGSFLHSSSNRSQGITLFNPSGVEEWRLTNIGEVYATSATVNKVSNVHGVYVPE